MELSEYKDLLQDKKPLIQVAMIKQDGIPHVTPLWFDVSDDDLNGSFLNINTATGRVKSRNIKIGTELALSIVDPEDLYRYIGFQGTVTDVIKGKIADDHIDALAKKYLNKDKYPYRNPNEDRIKIIIKLNTKYGNQ